MALSPNINDREMDKFVDEGGETKVRVKGNFTATLSGLNIAGRVTEVAIDNTSWTPLPATPLANRNAMAIQNRTGQEVKLNYDNSTVGYVGMAIDDKSERFYDITGNIIVYAKSKTSACTLTVEELS